MAVWYVDDAIGSSGDGTSEGAAFKTINEALAVMSGGDTVMVAGGVYNETLDLTGLGGASYATRTKFVGDSGDRFVISGGVPLSGLTQCTIGDEADVGANYASIYKQTIAKSLLPNSDPFAANICENGAALTIAHDIAATGVDRFFIDNPNYWHTADAVYKSGSLVTGFKKTSVTNAYTKAQIENSRVWFTKISNRDVFSDVSSFTSDIINLETPDTYATGESHADDFSLVNILPAMKAGQWGIKDNGTTVTIYVWPFAPASIAAGVVEYSSLHTGINFKGQSNIEFSDFVVRQIAPVTLSQAPIVTHGVACSGITLRDFEIKACWNADNAYAGIYLNRVDDLQIYNFNIDWMAGMFGIFVRGDYSSSVSATNYMTNGHIHDGTLTHIGSAPVRCYTVKDFVISHLFTGASAQSTHSNSFNAYQHCHNVLFWGINAQDTGGFATWQASSGIVIAFCALSASRAASGGARAIYNQQGSEANPNTYFTKLENYIFNNRAVPNPANYGSFDNSLKAADADDTNNNYTVNNNIYHGHSANDFGARVTEWDYNFTTAGTAYGANDEAAAIGDVYTSVASEDWSYKPGAAVRSFVAKNMSSVITELETRFPQMTAFNKDMVGGTINWASPPIGPTVNLDADYTNGGGGSEPPALPVMPADGQVTLAFTVG